MSTRLQGLLQAVLSGQTPAAERAAAEAELASAVRQPGTAAALFELATQQQCAATAALAWVLLRRHLPLIPTADVPLLEAAVLDCLGVPMEANTARAAVALAAAIAAHHGGHWGALEARAGALFGCTDHAAGIERVAAVVVELAAVIPVGAIAAYASLVPALLQAGCDASLSMPSATRRQAVRAVNAVVLVCGLGEGGRGPLAVPCAASYDPLLAAGLGPLGEDLHDNQWRRECTLLASLVADYADVARPAHLQAHLEALSRDAGIFAAANAALGPVAESVAHATSARWDAVGAFLAARDRREALLGALAGGDLVPAVVHVAVGYAGLSAAQRAEWHEACAVLRDEDDREGSVSAVVRDKVVAVLQALLKAAPAGAGPLLDAAVGGILHMPDTAEGHERCEALLFLLGNVLERRFKAVSATPAAQQGALQAIAQRVEGALGQGPPLLTARSLLFLRTLFSVPGAVPLVADMGPRLLPAATATLASSDSLLSAASALLLGRLVPATAPATLYAAGWGPLGAVLEAAAGAEEDMLYLLLEVAAAWLKRLLRAPAGPALPILQQVPAAVLAIWNDHMADPNVAELAVEAISTCLRRSAAARAGMLPVLPSVAAALAGAGDDATVCAVPSMLTITAALVGAAEEPEVAAAVAQTLLGPLCGLLLQSDGSGLTTTATKVLAAVLRRAGDDSNFYATTVHMTAADSQSPVAMPVGEAVQRIAQRLLAPEAREMGLLNSGTFLAALVPPVGACGGLAALLAALAERALSVRTDVVFQQLLIPISAIATQAPLDTLQALATAGHLVPLMGRWLPLQPELDGSTTHAVTVAALCAMLTAATDSAHAAIFSAPALSVVGKRQRVSLPAALFAAIAKEVHAAHGPRRHHSHYKPAAQEDDGGLIDALKDSDSGTEEISSSDGDGSGAEASADEEESMSTSGHAASGAPRTRPAIRPEYTAALRLVAAHAATLGPEAMALLTNKHVTALQQHFQSLS